MGKQASGWLLRFIFFSTCNQKTIVHLQEPRVHFLKYVLLPTLLVFMLCGRGATPGNLHRLHGNWNNEVNTFFIQVVQIFFSKKYE